MKFLSKLAICFLLVCLTQGRTFAQTLISTLSLASANLNASESQRYTNLQQDAFTKGLQVIKFGNPLDYLTSDGVLQFELPGFPGLVRARAVDITTTSTSYSWAGRLLTNNGYFGFYEIQGHRAAWFQTDNRFFEIMPLKDNLCTLREIDNDVLDNSNCFLSTVAQNTNMENELCGKDYNTCAATIDILVLLPSDTRKWLVNRFGGDAFATALYVGIGTQAINVAFANSDIPNKKVNIILENFEMTYTPVGNGCGSLLTALQSQATARRNAVGADLVVLLTATDYPCGSGAATAELGDPPFLGDPSFAFSEIWWLCTPRWSMLHEVGHLMGAGHNRPDDDDSDCAHGWTVGGNRFQRTLMANWFGTQTPTDMRILHYSNPDVVYNGDATGTVNDNNAKVIRNGACIVANYRQNNHFDASIDTDPWVCRSWGNIYLYSIVQQPSASNPGVPPYTYEWRWNYSGNFSGGNSSSTLIGTTWGLSFPIPAVSESFWGIWVQMKVTSSDGITITKLVNIKVFEATDPKCSQMRNPRLDSQHTSILGEKLLVAPNPANMAAQVSWLADMESNIDLAIYDGLGRSIFSQHLNQVAGENSYQINMEKLPAGMYTILLRSGKRLLAQKLVVSH